MDPDKCFGPDGSAKAGIQSRKASARVGKIDFFRSRASRLDLAQR